MCLKSLANIPKLDLVLYLPTIVAPGVHETMPWGRYYIRGTEVIFQDYKLRDSRHFRVAKEIYKISYPYRKNNFLWYPATKNPYLYVSTSEALGTLCNLGRKCVNELVLR